MLEVIAIVLALQLLVGRSEVWLPDRWRAITMAGGKRASFIDRLTRMIAWLERYSRPRGRFLFANRVGNTVFALLVVIGSSTAFIAPPFSWLDTLPALGVVVLSVAVLLEDVLLAMVGVAIEAGGILLVVVAGKAAFNAIEDLFGAMPPL